MSAPSVEVPDQSHVGEPLSVAVSGFPPESTAAIRVSTTDGYGRTCEAETRIETDRDGVARVEPFDGSLLWNLSPPEGRDPPFFVAADAAAFRVGIEVECESGTRVSTETTRRYADPNVDVREITDPVVGTVFEPSGAGPFPGVIVLHGSDPDLWKSLPETTSIRHLLASQGYVVLSLRYIGDETPTPAGNFVTSTSYFRSAVDWLRDQPAVSSDPVGAVGVSRGGEGALLIGSRFDDVGSVVAYVPSTYRFPWPVTGEDETAYWGDDTGALPYVPPGSGDRERPSVAQFRNAVIEADEERLRDATIPVTEISGRVLFVSGVRDAVWPSTYLSEVGMNHLVAEGMAERARHVAGGDAGHAILAPYRDYSRAGTLGGTAEGNARAAARAWPHVLRTLAPESQ